jgi:hypothetical protein
MLHALSISRPPPNSTPEAPAEWTVDALFLIPRTRLKYYKKLYTRLLKSTQPGRSDHKLLVGANEELTQLIETVDGRAGIRVGADEDHQDPREMSRENSDEFLRRESGGARALPPVPPHGGDAPPVLNIEHRPSPPPPHFDREHGNTSSSSFRPDSSDHHPQAQPSLSLSAFDRGRESLQSEGNSSRSSRGTASTAERLSRDTAATSAAERTPPVSGNFGGSIAGVTTGGNIQDLEKRLSTERVLDLFSMLPKVGSIHFCQIY